MNSRPGDTPGLESSMASGLFGALSSPLGMSRHTISYDESLDAAMHSPPPDMSINNLWTQPPVIPKRRFKKIPEEEERGIPGVQASQSDVAGAARSSVPVVKAKASSLMNTLMIKQTQESLQRFEQQAGLTDAGYTPHKGLAAEETRFHLLPEMPKLKMPSGDYKEDRLTSSAQSTPSGTPCGTPSPSPCSSPALSRRSWFNLSPVPFLTTPELSSPTTEDMGGNEGGGGVGTDRWSFFGTRPVVQKSSTDPGSETNQGGFTLQSYFGLQKSTTMDSIKTQINLKVDDPASFMPPKIEISGIEANRPLPRPHKLKPRDMNVLTPSGF